MLITGFLRRTCSWNKGQILQLPRGNAESKPNCIINYGKYLSDKTKYIFNKTVSIPKRRFSPGDSGTGRTQFGPRKAMSHSGIHLSPWVDISPRNFKPLLGPYLDSQFGTQTGTLEQQHSPKRPQFWDYNKISTP